MSLDCPAPSAVDDHAQSLLRYQLKPSLVLDAVGTVTAINAGGLRLLCTSPSGSHVPNPIIGRNISDLSIAISPDRSPALWTWAQILTTAANGHGNIEDNEQRTETPLPDHDVFQDSDNFWRLETRKQSLIESNVYLIKTAPGVSTSSTSGGAQGSFKIKARASVCWFSPGVFLVVFDQPSMPSLERSPSPAGECASYPDVKSLAPAHCLSHTATALSPTNGTNPGYHMPSTAQVTLLIPYIMAVLDVEGQVMQLSDFWYQFTGLSKEESLGSGWISAIHPDDVVQMTSAWANVLEHKRRDWTHEARYLETATGEYYWFLIRAQVCEDASGQAVCWYASMMDINHAVIARQDVDRRRQSMLTLISRTDVLLWGIDRANRLYIREGGLKWDPPECPLSRDTARKDKSQGSNHCENEELVSAVQVILAGRDFTPVIEHTEGGRYFRTIFVAERGAGDDKDAITEAALALTFETTDQVVQSALRLENERLALDEKAASEASALKSRFLANMSHEIRTPISGIIGLSELLRDTEITMDQADLVRDIHSSAQFLLALVNDILDLSKINSGQLSIECIPFSLCETIRDTLVPLQIHANKKGLGLNWTCDLSTETALLGDPHRTRQVLTNLIGNSLKFTHKGTVHLNVTCAQGIDSETLHVQFIVQDTGIGMAEDAREMLFKPFSQADTSTARIYGGTGLGLSICQELVELMGGHMKVQSALGKGTEVTFDLPFKLYHSPGNKMQTSLQLPDRTQPRERTKSVAAVQPLDQEPTRSQQQPTWCAGPPAARSNLLVLLIDDNAINLKINSRFIAKSGYGIATASNGQEALDYLCKTSRQRQPDIILMDCMMPVVDGHEATRRIRNDEDLFDERTRKLPIVALTASGLQSDRERCREVGMDDFICRPVSQKALNDAVLKWAAPGDT